MLASSFSSSSLVNLFAALPRGGGGSSSSQFR